MKYTPLYVENVCLWMKIWFNSQTVERQVLSGYVFVLPERDSEGRRVIFNYAQVSNSKHSKKVWV